VEWKEEFSVGVPQQDEEHQMLVQCLTDIENAVSKGDSRDTVQAKFERLISSMRVHFSGEENLMRKYRYPHLATHLKEHQDFLDEVEAIGLGSLDAPVSSETVALLQRSFERHFRADEKDYGAFLSGWPL
jgi:hemerythrin-like metal-binding protein